MHEQIALIVGAGSGLSASLARLFAKEGARVALAARDTGKLAALAKETGALTLACDATQAPQVDAAFAEIEREWRTPDLVVYNAGYRTRGPLVELDPKEVERTITACAYGGFLVGQAAAKRMLRRVAQSAAQDSARQGTQSVAPDSARQGSGAGAIFFTGASASVKGYAESAPFAMGKFALRGLAQSMARELAPKGVHVAHFVIDGGIRRGDADPRAGERGSDGMLLPDEIAKTYLHVYRQHRSAWTWEVELRPWVERF
jgi:NAD(P)-dependent dehydrogenase (short-subunit alcohol dehydrogenase family)